MRNATILWTLPEEKDKSKTLHMLDGATGFVRGMRSALERIAAAQLSDNTREIVTVGLERRDSTD